MVLAHFKINKWCYHNEEEEDEEVSDGDNGLYCIACDIYVSGKRYSSDYDLICRNILTDELKPVNNYLSG